MKVPNGVIKEPKVVHCKEEPFDVYIGRGNGSIWGNPFSHKEGTKAAHKTKTAEEAVQKYEEWLLKQSHLLEKLPELKGKVLACWCKSKRQPDAPCHGDVLLKYSNDPTLLPKPTMVSSSASVSSNRHILTFVPFPIDNAVCFTGHRPNKLGGYNEFNPIARYVMQELLREIEFLIEEGKSVFISGMALGVDMWAAEAVLNLRKKYPHIKLIAAVPFEGQEKKWPLSSQERWRRIVVEANQVVQVNEPGYAGWKMQSRNEWMVDHASVVVAVWNGTSGGTGNCVRYAESAIHQPIVVRIDPNQAI
ncbi:SLOG family protein [Cytobacillus sp. FJAT-54145]|uniref:SLOG family protein n=1 Tax=Cytobacillus spartinae TaxID=3299023 RepID=A0ABW6KE70_9BACI